MESRKKKSDVMLNQAADQLIHQQIQLLMTARSPRSPLINLFDQDPDIVNHRMSSIPGNPPVLFFLASSVEGREIIRKNYRLISFANSETLNYVIADGTSLLLLLVLCYDRCVFSDSAVRAKLTSHAFNVRNSLHLSAATALIDFPRSDDDRKYNKRCYYRDTIELFHLYPELAEIISDETLACLSLRVHADKKVHTLLWHFINDHSNALQVLSESKALRKHLNENTINNEISELLVETAEGRKFLLKSPRIQQLAARHVSLAPSHEVSSGGHIYRNFADTEQGRRFIGFAHQFRAQLTTQSLKANLAHFGTRSLVYFLLTTLEGQQILHKDPNLCAKLDATCVNMDFKSNGRAYTAFFANDNERQQAKTCDSILICMLTRPHGVAFLLSHPVICRLINRAGLIATMEEGPYKGLSAGMLIQKPGLETLLEMVLMNLISEKNVIQDLTNHFDWSQQSVSRRRP